MTVHFNTRNTTDALTAAETFRQSTDKRIRRRWARPAAMAAIVAVGLVGGYRILDMNSTNTTSTTAPHVKAPADAGPLIVAEEQAFIDRQHGRMPVVVTAAVAANRKGVEPLIIAEERAFIDGEYSQGTTSSDDWCATHSPC